MGFKQFALIMYHSSMVRMPTCVIKSSECKLRNKPKKQ